MKEHLNSYLHKISNIFGRNEVMHNTQNEDAQDNDNELVHMSYSEYIQYINEEEHKKATPLQPDIYSN